MVVQRVGDLPDTGVTAGGQGDQVRGVRRYGCRPDDPLVVVVRLHDAGEVAPHADPIGAHDDRVFLAVLAQVGRAQGGGVPRAELEDVAHFDAVAQLDGRPAHG